MSVQAVVLGKVRDVLTNADTAGELLSAMGIQPDADDRVRPSPETPLHAGSTLTFDEVRVVTEMDAITIPFDVEVRYTPRMIQACRSRCSRKAVPVAGSAPSS